ncbi:MAG: hypothetical protein GXO23_02755 [Crenarchaeota archaeon]|nr:hypothetical protein [Thermoproteota archaeon]
MLRNIVKIRRVSEQVREITTIDEKVILGRCVSLGNLNIVDIDVVEPATTGMEVVSEHSIEGRRILIVRLDSNVQGLVYESDNLRELISVKIVLEREVGDEELLDIVENTLKKYAPSYYERLRRILAKYYGEGGPS